MGLEIEQKYLVRNDSYREMPNSVREIRQGYLSRVPERTVRVRTVDDKGFITVKGLTRGLVRLEYEYEIPVTDARELLTLCDPPVIEKRRYIVDYAGKKWEVDEFMGHLSPLVVAEIELNSEDEQYEIPPFIGKNVTGDPRYYNSNLSEPGN